MKPFNLDNEPKIKSGFTAPEGYFDSFTDRIMQQLPAQETPVIPLYRRAKVWLSGVAAVLVLALGLTVYFKTGTTKQPDDSAIENYLVYQSGLNSYDLIQNLDQQDIKELEQSIAINDDAIADYLYEQNIINE
jgi:hypothetical protein